MAETLSLVVSSLVFVADNLAIFTGLDSEGKRLRVVARGAALPRTPVVGELWKISGVFQEHPDYGRQLNAMRCSAAPPKGRLVISYLAGHPDFVGIGGARAKALYATFGDQLVEVLDAGDLERLAAVLSRELAQSLVVTWAEKQAEAAVVVFLDEHGFDLRLASKLRRIWGEQVITMLQLNPYHLLAFASWTQTDAAAAKLGVAPGDSRRLVGAVEAALYGRLQEAHTVTSATQLKRRIAKLLNTGLNSEQCQAAIDLAYQEGAIVGDACTGYQPVGAAALEVRIAERMRSMLAGEQATQASLFPAEFGPAWLESAICENESAQGFALNSRQREAVLMAVTKPFSVLTGGAGVGKTTVLRVVIDIAQRLEFKVIQMALAGRAAMRMAEATGHEAMTIAKFLHQAKDGKLEVTADTLVIVDEASMLDLPTTFRILKYLPDGVRLLLVGDPAQLPPIGFGLVFHRLVQSIAVPQVELTEVHRQAAATGIPAVATAIRAHLVPDLGCYRGCRPGVSFIEVHSSHIQGVLQQLADDWQGENWQVLSAVKAGPSGIEAINGQFHQNYEGECLNGYRFRAGEPVIHLVNDYERGLMNGTLGRILEVSHEGTPGLYIDFEGTEHFIPASEVTERLELAYAISVHKAQGSQFRRVAVVITRSRILDHALVYTALTRGIEQVVFLGDKAAFEQAVQSPALAHLREVAFSI